jgi:hypothetical protein
MEKVRSSKLLASKYVITTQKICRFEDLKFWKKLHDFRKGLKNVQLL